MGPALHTTCYGRKFLNNICIDLIFYILYCFSCAPPMTDYLCQSLPFITIIDDDSWLSAYKQNLSPPCSKRAGHNKFMCSSADWETQCYVQRMRSYVLVCEACGVYYVFQGAYKLTFHLIQTASLFKRIYKHWNHWSAPWNWINSWVFSKFSSALKT